MKNETQKMEIKVFIRISAVNWEGGGSALQENHSRIKWCKNNATKKPVIEESFYLCRVKSVPDKCLQRA